MLRIWKVREKWSKWTCDLLGVLFMIHSRKIHYICTLCSWREISSLFSLHYFCGFFFFLPFDFLSNDTRGEGAISLSVLSCRSFVYNRGIHYFLFFPSSVSWSWASLSRSNLPEIAELARLFIFSNRWEISFSLFSMISDGYVRISQAPRGDLVFFYEWERNPFCAWMVGVPLPSPFISSFLLPLFSFSAPILYKTGMKRLSTRPSSIQPNWWCHPWKEM